MKRYLLSALVLICLGQVCRAQEASDYLRADVLVDIRGYFISIEDIDGIVNVFVDPEKYKGLSRDAKVSLFSNMSSGMAGKDFVVRYGYKRELWQMSDLPTVPGLIDSWDMNDPEMAKFAPIQTPRSSKHPWFFYAGGQIYADDSYSQVFLSSRAGVFLYKNIWDMAVSNSLGYRSLYFDSTGSNNYCFFDIGINTRLYYPIKKIRLSPYIGVGISYNLTLGNDSDTTHSLNIPMSTGVSWLVGPGSLDIGIQYSKLQKLVGTVGYTFRPNYKRR